MSESLDVRIVAVGCDPIDLAVLATVASAHSFHLDAVDLAPDLVDALRARPPDAVLLDVRQRGTTGFVVCAQWKADPELARVPVLLISSVDGPEARRRAYAAGCDEYVEKPFDRAQLGHRLRSFARLRRAWARPRGGA